jgi:protein-disulfide isomerase
VLEKYPNQIKFVYKHYPLRSHKFAVKAAKAALAAHADGKFWQFHDRLFKDYRNLNDKKISEIAVSLGFDPEQFNKKMADPAIQQLIQRDIDNGRQVGIRGIPTVFIRGKRLKDRSINGFEQMIAKELKKAAR